jgi:hypothetical protein
MCAHKRMGCTEIARTLNQNRVKRGDKGVWNAYTVYRILTNAKYAGSNVWNRTTQRLHSTQKAVAPEDWITKANAFRAIVTKSTFERAQERLHEAERGWSDDELLRKLRLLFIRRGRLSERLIARSKGMPGVATYYNRLGTFDRIYKLVGYRPPASQFKRSITRRRTHRLRETLFARIETLFHGRVTVFRLPGKMRSLLKLGDCVVSVLLCPTLLRPNRSMCWSLNPVSSESQYITLLCRLNSANDGLYSLHLFPGINKSGPGSFTERNPWLLRGQRLDGLDDLYEAVTLLHRALTTIQKRDFPSLISSAEAVL